MWHWFRFKRESEDPLAKFVETQRKLGRKVRTSGISEKNKEKLAGKHGKDLAELLGILGSSLTPLKVERISLVCHERKGRSIWFSPAKKEPAKVVIDLEKALPITPRVRAEIEQVIEKSKLIKVEEPLLSEALVTSQKKVVAQPSSEEGKVREVATGRLPGIILEKSRISPIRSHYQRGRALALEGNLRGALREYSHPIKSWGSLRARYARWLALWWIWQEEGDLPAFVEFNDERAKFLKEDRIDLEYEELLSRAMTNKQNVIDFEPGEEENGFE